VKLTPVEFLPESTSEIRNELDRLHRDLLLTDAADKYFLTHGDGAIIQNRELCLRCILQHAQINQPRHNIGSFY
jgi:hypothetical protein